MTQPTWLPPIPNRSSSRFRWRLMSMICLLLAAGPIVLLARWYWPQLESDPILAYLLGAIMGSIIFITLVAVLSSRLRSELVVTALLASMILAVPAIVWLGRVLIREQERLERMAKVAPPDSAFYIRLGLATLVIVLTLGLAVGFVASMRREGKF
jgi:hypothetical protein